MGLWNQLSKLFKRDDRFDNKRTFKELVRIQTMEEALELKTRLEKAEIPVYMLDLRNVGKTQSYIAIRVPGKFMNQARTIMDSHE